MAALLPVNRQTLAVAMSVVQANETFDELKECQRNEEYGHKFQDVTSNGKVVQLTKTEGKRLRRDSQALVNLWHPCGEGKTMAETKRKKDTYLANVLLVRKIIRLHGGNENGFANACQTATGNEISGATIRNMLAGKRAERARYETIFRYLSTNSCRVILDQSDAGKELKVEHWYDLVDYDDAAVFRGSPKPAVVPTEQTGQLHQETENLVLTTATEATNMVSLAEFGPFLEKYAELTGIDSDKAAKALHACAGQQPEAPEPFKSLNEAQFKKFLEDNLYRGLTDVRVPFHQLDGMLTAFCDEMVDGNGRELPTLMAEWLCAAPCDGSYVHLPFGEFSRPTVDDARSPATFGVKCSYSNAPRRLTGLECAIVRLELEANDPPPKVDGEQEIDRLTQLLRFFGEKNTETIPHSNSHRHPGDEIILVTEGTLFVQLDNTGIWTPISQGDYIHFNAEIPHAVWNVGTKRATAIIVRFFQLRRHGTRSRQIAILKKIQDLLSGLSKKYKPNTSTRLEAFAAFEQNIRQWLWDTQATYRLWTEIAPWVHDRTRPPGNRLRHVNTNSQVQDLVGLSNFLLTYVASLPDDAIAENNELLQFRDAVRRLEDFRRTSDAIGKNESRNRNGFKKTLEVKKALSAFLKKHFGKPFRTSVRCCFEGLPPQDRSARHPDVSTLIAIVRILNKGAVAELPRVLLDGYLPPNALRVVTVRGATSTSRQKPLDWVSPPPGAAGADAPNVEYLIPARTLANSDVSVVLLDLAANGNTAWNWHPGFEMVIPINGAVQVELEKSGTISISEVTSVDSLVAYRSSIRHRVRNPTNEKARVVVIRFNIADSYTETKQSNSTNNATTP